ncbi:MAG: LysM peptidoglycan-binding domain-containing protein [Verrucomicrobiota bacterium]
MRFHETHFPLALVLAGSLGALGPVQADDDLPAWSSREAAQVKQAKAAPAAEKPAPAPVERETIIYGENTSDEAPVEVSGPVDADPEVEVVERKVRVIHVKSHQKSLSSKSKPLLNQNVTTKVVREERPVESEADRLPQPVSRPSAPAASPEPKTRPAPAAPARMLVYTIKKGDTLWGISRQFKVTVDAIKIANGLTDNLIKPGQQLSIPSGETKKRVAATPRPQSTTPVANSPTPRAASLPAETARSGSSVNTEGTVLSANERVRRAQLKLRDTAIKLARHDINYNQKWRPPGEKEAWTMDCSNTSRYLFKTVGLKIPRTASSQYWELDNQRLVWRAPKDDEGRPSKDWLARNLKVGDLLFWEHTYKPVRTPPVTHVTVFLGRNKKGEWIMAGSQSAQAGELTDDAGGPDLYVFNPHASSGGYSTGFLGMEKVKGRFVGIGRPLGLLSKDDGIRVSSR